MNFCKSLAQLSKLEQRLFAGKIIGASFGAIAISIFCYFNDWDWALLGVLFYMSIYGALLGLVGLWRTHPVFKFPMPWWIRGPIVGVFFHLGLVLLLWNSPVMEGFLSIANLQNLTKSQIIYFEILEGAVLGLIIDYFLTKHFGDGQDLLKK